MKREERIRITVSKEEITVIRKMQGNAQANCAACGQVVEMATPEQAATITGSSSRAIYSWVESGRLHFIETAGGHLLVCLDSLRADKLLTEKQS